MRFGCLINTRSGGYKGQQLLQELKTLSGGYLLDIFEASQQGTADLIASLAEYDRILIAGGDGTVFQFLNAAKDCQVPICVYPLGTGNDLARELNLPALVWSMSTQGALEFFEKAPVVDIDSWLLSWTDPTPGSAIFTNYASFGFDGQVVQRFHVIREKYSWIPRYFGRIGNRACYGLAGMLCLLSKYLRIIKIVADGKLVEVRTPLRTLFFSNISSVMGLTSWNPGGDPGDGLLELRELRNIFGYAALLLGLKSEDNQMLSSQKWSIELEHPIPFQIDGEDFSHILSSNFTIERARAIRFCSAS